MKWFGELEFKELDKFLRQGASGTGKPAGWSTKQKGAVRGAGKAVALAKTVRQVQQLQTRPQAQGRKDWSRLQNEE